jgi:hypothetical protein
MRSLAWSRGLLRPVVWMSARRSRGAGSSILCMFGLVRGKRSRVQSGDLVRGRDFVGLCNVM